MKLILLYRDARADAPPAQQVARRLHESFSRVHEGLDEPVVRSSPAGTLVLLQLPVGNCRASFVQEDERTWAVAPDHPVDAHRALRAVRSAEAHADLLGVCRELERDPEPLLRELAPPFGAAWFSKEKAEIRVQVDGLGRSQFFEHRSKDAWALSNRPMAFRALGLELSPEPLDWAVRFSISHFVGEQSGFAEVRMLEPGTQVHVTPDAVRRERHDVLAHWLGSEQGSVEAAEESAREALLAQVEAGAGQLEIARLGLSGGLDSRVIAACLKRLGLPFEAQVRGEAWRSDVLIAQRIAEAAGIALELKRGHRLKRPPETAEGCRDAVKRALLLSAGGRTAQSYKTYFPGTRRLRAGRAELTGHGGEIARSFYGKRLSAKLRPGGDPDELLVDSLMRKRAPVFLRPELAARAREVVLERCRRASALGLEGQSRWDHFYLCERERRFIGSHGAARTALEVIPFLAPGFLRASFRLPAAEKLHDRLHRLLLARLAPEWTDIPFKSEIVETPPPAPALAAESDWRRPEGRHDYDNRLYWQDVGRPLIEDCLKGEGFWTELFDADRARAHWSQAPDELVIAALLPELVGD